MATRCTYYLYPRYPYSRLSRTAIDLFTIPAMSDGPERTFSSCSLIITSHRGSLESDVVEYTQCTKNRLRNGVISPQVLTGTRDGGIDDEETIHIDWNTCFFPVCTPPKLTPFRSHSIPLHSILIGVEWRRGSLHSTPPIESTA
jgi:hypothetical protein